MKQLNTIIFQFPSSSSKCVVLFLFVKSLRLRFVCRGGASVKKLIILSQSMYKFMYSDDSKRSGFREKDKVRNRPVGGAFRRAEGGVWGPWSPAGSVSAAFLGVASSGPPTVDWAGPFTQQPARSSSHLGHSPRSAASNSSSNDRCQISLPTLPPPRKQRHHFPHPPGL